MRRSMTLLTLAAGAVLTALTASACGDELTPETQVDALRVLGVRAEPAELAPGDTATLTGFIVDPSSTPLDRAVLWIGCDPDPAFLERSACSDTDVLGALPGLGGEAESSAALPPGLNLLGIGDTARYRAPEGTFATLAPDDPRRQLGTVAQVLMIAIAEAVPLTASEEELRALFGRVRRREVRSVVTLARLRVTEQRPLNVNPTLAQLFVDDAPLPAGATVRAPRGQGVDLRVTAPDEAFEPYVALLPTGPEDRVERVIAAWYGTSGNWEDPRATLATEAVSRFTPEDEDRGELFVVLRDTRGGQAFERFRFAVCDEARPTPVVSALTPAAARPGETVTLRGEALDSVLDVVLEDPSLGAFALERVAFSPSADGVLGVIPSDAPMGRYAIKVRGLHCRDESTALSLEVSAP